MFIKVPAFIVWAYFDIDVAFFWFISSNAVALRLNLEK